MAGLEDLAEALERTGMECLNADAEHPLKNAVDQNERENEAKVLKSDCDAQLLIHLTFSQIVRVHSLVIQTPAAHRVGHGPAKAALYVNKPTLDFDAAGSEKPAQEIVISSEHLEGKPIELKVTSFQNVSTLSIFVKENRSGDEDEPTIISKIGMLGYTTAGSGRKRTVEEQKASQAGDWLNTNR